MILSNKLMKLNASAKVLLKKNIHNIKKMTYKSHKKWLIENLR